MLLLNHATEVVAEDLAEHFVHHRRRRLAPHGIAELPLNHAERAFHVAPLVVVGKILVLLELEVVKHLLE